MNPTTKVLTLCLVGALVAGGATAAVRANRYADRALEGTTVAGVDVSGMTLDEAAAAIQSRVDTTTLSVEVGQSSAEYTLADLGVQVDAKASAENALAANADLLTRVLPHQAHSVDLVAERDQSAQSGVLETLVRSAGAPVVDAAVKRSADGATYVVSPASEGVAVSTEGFAQAVDQALTTLRPSSVSLSVEHTTPRVTTEQANAVAAKANALLAPEVKLTDGVDNFVASAADKAAWVSIPQSGGVLGEPAVDATKVREWVDKVAASTNEEARPGQKSINSRGEVVGVQYAGGKSLRASNQAEVAKGVLQAVQGGAAYAGDFDYQQVDPELVTVNVPDWNKDDVYSPAAGQRWIDVDLTQNTVSAYEGRVLVQGPVYMVPGAPGTETITGTYAVYLKYDAQTMRGENLDGSKYETPDVPWVMYFTGGYALHGAYWRSEFGWSGYGGSHGCVNMPVEQAKWFYDWAGLGTPVISHY
ncbi:L,D-transpeptidase family protein [Schaalia sp. 19OD2882]|uniref:L,D-transpeptidase n=1 Tax=Schaalia sp. 19OD2882 TaxID=2794089 RepID=UPI001C1EB02F|nr:L,D-transpeptidase [Schaalia sp. 19OD2882]QWW20488.1 L,D-transpeptidase family protein [Schaalia sp. 19OD2882]